MTHSPRFEARKLDHRAHPVIVELHDRINGTGLRLTEVCKAAGISTETWRGWRSGTSSPRLADLEALANVAGLEITVRPSAGASQARRAA